MRACLGRARVGNRCDHVLERTAQQVELHQRASLNQRLCRPHQPQLGVAAHQYPGPVFELQRGARLRAGSQQRARQQLFARHGRSARAGTRDYDGVAMHGQQAHAQGAQPEPLGRDPQLGAGWHPAVVRDAIELIQPGPVRRVLEETLRDVPGMVTRLYRVQKIIGAVGVATG